MSRIECSYINYKFLIRFFNKVFAKIAKFTKMIKKYEMHESRRKSEENWVPLMSFFFLSGTRATCGLQLRPWYIYIYTCISYLLAIFAFLPRNSVNKETAGSLKNWWPGYKLHVNVMVSIYKLYTMYCYIMQMTIEYLVNISPETAKYPNMMAGP